MKSLTAIVSLVFFLLSASQIAIAESTYTLTQGKQWHGVKIGGKAPRSPDIICRNYACYPFKTIRSISREVMHKYGLRNLSYDQLAAAPGVQQNGDRLSLPRDLGYEMHRLAFEDYNRDMKDSTGGGSSIFIRN
ncbi:MAG: hypothetical protein V7731_03300 [Amphritea sp.]